MKIQIFLLILFHSFIVDLSAQNNYYAVEFTDKDHNLFTLEKPQDFLSDKALLRRKNHNIALTETDLPLTSAYLFQVKKQGAKVVYISKWLNTAIVICTEMASLEIIELYFVEKVTYVGKTNEYDFEITEKKKNRKVPKVVSDSFYGRGQNQIEMLNGVSLHEKNNRGKGITVAVLDGGFWRADDLKVLNKVQASSSQLKNRDFVNRDKHVFESSAHGTEILSIMAADLPGVMVGTAPDADYICLKTEDVRFEFWIDEYTWVVGLEYADFVGADLIVSGLGYTTFDDTSMNYTQEDLQKNSAISTRAANIAFEKGMIIVCSAGNEGDNDWKYVSCPADGKGVLAIGAVDKLGKRASFASLTSEIGGMTKPDLNALGVNVTVASVVGKELTRQARGSSYSAPIIGGLTASLWSAFPNQSNQTIVNAVKLSAKESNNFGLPNFTRAYEILANTQKNVNSHSSIYVIQP